MNVTVTAGRGLSEVPEKSNQGQLSESFILEENQ